MHKTSWRNFAQGAAFAVCLLAFAYFSLQFLVSRVELADSLNKAFARQGKGIIYNALGKSLEDAIRHLDQPDSIEPLRTEEQLAYWNYDPILLQIHFHKNRALRVAYFTNHQPTKELLVREILNHFSEDSAWKRSTVLQGGTSKTYIVNTVTENTIVDQDNGVLLYSFNPQKRAAAEERSAAKNIEK